LLSDTQQNLPQASHDLGAVAGIKDSQQKLLMILSLEAGLARHGKGKEFRQVRKLFQRLLPRVANWKKILQCFQNLLGIKGGAIWECGYQPLTQLPIVH
jgi:hypothetical protein